MLPRLLATVVLVVWAAAVLAAAADMLAVWNSQLQGAGQAGDAYVAIWQRLALLAIAGVGPPALAWMIWRLAARLAAQATPPQRTP